MFVVHLVHIALVALVGTVCIAVVIPGVFAVAYYWFYDGVTS